MVASMPGLPTRPAALPPRLLLSTTAPLGSGKSIGRRGLGRVGGIPFTGRQLAFQILNLSLFLLELSLLSANLFLKFLVVPTNSFQLAFYVLLPSTTLIVAAKGYPGPLTSNYWLLSSRSHCIK
jgi:hypothetical protein